MKVVIVGGVGGGATAAARIRRLDEQAEIVIFERSGYISYANCGLPYYVGTSQAGTLHSRVHSLNRRVLRSETAYPSRGAAKGARAYRM